MLVGGVIGDKIQDHPQPARMRRRQQSVEVAQGPEQRIDAGVIGHIVAEVSHG